MSASQCEECGDVYDPTAGHRCKTYTVVGLPSNAEVEAVVAARVHLWVPGLRWEHCCTCGACCVGWQIDVYASDDVPEQLVVPWGGDAVDSAMREVADEQHGTRCAALCGAVGRSVSCSIYDRRPVVCRDFLVGGLWCLEQRDLHGVEEK